MKSRDSLIRLKRFQVDEKRRQVTQIEMMIADFNRMISDLDDQIVAEQNRVGIHDVAHFETLAWAADGRLRAAVDEVLPLERGAEAFGRLRRRQVGGKLVLVPRA
jgi:hypothetical protein